MNTDVSLRKFIIFSGWLEIVFGVLFCFMDFIFKSLDIPNSPFFSIASGVMMIILGFLLWYSARDLKRYLIIPVMSCIFRFAMVLGPTLMSLFLIPLLIPIWIFAMTYDSFSALLTLALLKKAGYLTKENL